jgi:peptidoglycan/LPS O-acetylase OafA/YrhL
MTLTIPTQPTATGVVAPPPPRMAWLDALRGLAVVVVAWYHLSPSVIGQKHYLAIHRYIDLGKFGVLLFFLVSGYVIPMSLERHGSMRKFWAGRLFRIYPAYLAAIAAILVLIKLKYMPLPPTGRSETATSVLGHVTMMSDVLGARGLIWPFWTLTFEMIFYLLVGGLFVFNLHRFSVWWAAGLALIAAVIGPNLPDAQFGATVADRRMLAGLLVLVVALSLAGYLSGRRLPVLLAGVAGLGFIALPLLNGHPTKWSTATSSWQAVLMLAVMFAGTVVYRMHHGQIRPLAGGIALAVVLVCSAGTTWLHTRDLATLRQWGIGSVAVAVTFAVAFALRHRRIPAAIAWLGAVSYSIYLLHMVVLYGVGHFLNRKNPTFVDRVLLGVAFAAVTLLVAWLCYRYVEKPGQRLGRWVQRRLDTGLGPDRTRRLPPPPGTTRSAQSGTGRVEMSAASV